MNYVLLFILSFIWGSYRKERKKLNDEHSETIEWLCNGHRKELDMVADNLSSAERLCKKYIAEINGLDMMVGELRDERDAVTYIKNQAQLEVYALKRQLANRKGQITKLKRRLSDG